MRETLKSSDFCITCKTCRFFVYQNNMLTISQRKIGISIDINKVFFNLGLVKKFDNLRSCHRTTQTQLLLCSYISSFSSLN